MSDPLDILYPNGQVEGVQVFVWDGLKPILWDGSVTFSGSLPSTVAGNKTNDNAAPGATNLGALTAVATVVAPSYTEGFLVALSTDLTGALRVSATIDTTGLATSAKQDTGNASLATIAAKDFATQTTLALIKAKTDNIDVLLSTRTKPADAQHVIVDSSAAIAVTGPLTDTQLRATAVPISAASLPLPTGASTLAEQQSQTSVLGATNGTAVITDANGSIQQYLRGIVKLLITAGGALVTATLAAGSAIIGKVGIDQTTPGTTNGVQVNAALPAGTNALGSVTITTGKTLKSASGSFSSDTDVIAAVSSKRLKVFALKVETFGTSATTILWKSNGAGGTEVWRSIVQSIASTKDGETHATSVPSFLFATAAGEKLTADTNTGDTIHYTISYWDDDAT